MELTTIAEMAMRLTHFADDALRQDAQVVRTLSNRLEQRNAELGSLVGPGIDNRELRAAQQAVGGAREALRIAMTRLADATRHVQQQVVQLRH